MTSNNTTNTSLTVEEWQAKHPGEELTFWAPVVSGAISPEWLCTPDALTEMNDTPFHHLGLVSTHTSMSEVVENVKSMNDPDWGLTHSPYGKCLACGVEVTESTEQKSA